MQINICTKCCSKRMVICWTVLMGLFFVGSLVLAFYGIPAIINLAVHGQTKLVENTDKWDRFVELPFPLNFSVRFLTVTNPEGVKAGSPPILNETVPYTYQMNLKRQAIRFDDSDEDSVTFNRSLSFSFVSSGTNKESDPIYIINPLLMSAFQLTSGIERIAAAGCFDQILKPGGLDQIFLNTTVEKLLWEGIPFARANEETLGVACGIIRKKLIDRAVKIRVIEAINPNATDEYAKIAVFNFKRPSYSKESPDGIYTMNRGVKNMTALGNVMRWNGATSLHTYGHASAINNETCQTVQGSDATIFHPSITQDEDLWVYNTDTLRKIISNNN